MPTDYPIWKFGETPPTHQSAKATAWRHVVGVTALRVFDARYRGCMPIDDVFELVSSTPSRVHGEDRYQVFCGWFGVKPPTTFPRIRIGPRGSELLSNYTGKVVDNIST